MSCKYMREKMGVDEWDLGRPVTVCDYEFESCVCQDPDGDNPEGCGWREATSVVCPECGEGNLELMGQGTLYCSQCEAVVADCQEAIELTAGNLYEAAKALMEEADPLDKLTGQDFKAAWKLIETSFASVGIIMQSMRDLLKLRDER